MNGLTGRTVRPKVEFATPANDAYHATTAVTIPSQPPALTTPVEADASPMPSTTKVIASSANTAMTAAVVRNEAIHMYVVKMPQAIR